MVRCFIAIYPIRSKKVHELQDKIAKFINGKSVEKEKIELSEEEVEEVISKPRVLKRIAIKAAALAYKRREEGEEEAKKEEKGGEEGNE